MSINQPIRILLVHGTFARESSWAKQNSKFCSTLREKLIPFGLTPEFEPISWPGHNLFSAREAGAQRIAAKIQEITNQYPTRKIFLIGHSHGGSAAAYFLKQHEHPSNVSGVFFLSTPFISANIRRPLREWIAALNYIMLFVSYFFCISLLLLLEYFFDTVESPIVINIINLAFCYLLSRMYMDYRYFEHKLDKIRCELQEVKRRHDSCTIKFKSSLIIRAVGDEAAFGLSFAQALAYVISKLSERIYISIIFSVNKIESYKLIGKGFFEMIALIAIVTWILFSPTLLRYNFSFDGFSEYYSKTVEKERGEITQTLKRRKTDEASNNYSVAASCTGLLEDESTCRSYTAIGRLIFIDIKNLEQRLRDTYKDSNIKWLMYLFDNLVRLISHVTMVLLFFLSVAILVALGFGYAQGSRSIYMNYSVEPAPYGEWPMLLLDPSREKSSFALFHQHSLTTVSDNSISTIAAWIKVLVGIDSGETVAKGYTGQATIRVSGARDIN